MSQTSKCLGTEQVQHVGFPEDNMPQNLLLEEFALGDPNRKSMYGYRPSLNNS